MAEPYELEYEYEGLSENLPLYLHLTAGAAAGILEHSVVYPLDSIKTRMQVVGVNRNMIYSTMFDSFRLVSTTEGFRSLWRGISSMIMGAGPAHAVHFAVYEQAKHTLSFGNTSSQPFVAGVAGGIGTAVSEFLMNPFDVVKQRMQANSSTYSSILSCTRSVFKTEGISAFFVSYPTTLIMNIPLQTIQFGLYEFFKTSFSDPSEYSPFTHILSGSLSGAIAAAVTTPIDCAKTLLQTRGISHDASVRSVNGIFTSLKAITSTFGFRGLFRGITPRVLSFMPATAISWTTYEYFKYILAQ
ncbi:hypothetical protein BB560_006994 [Smittium megazygosporum]|uniref:Mitochondrial thiamine pyrophosphate carrier 1 n=1 Tax=Smittium megazygosporum TaxID=133381 RepID=A0A2T9XZR0_9FUNG|nr:hypothetical protein BB560_006994 [Smittium megazygosporum]